jgi:insulysin
MSTHDEDIIKSQSDKCSYRHIVLANKLKILLVSDPDTEKSCACMNVKAGSMLDPSNAQGLAHFLEHMLFLGTEKYPEENYYSSFLNSHGGSSNAYTAQEETVYYFDILNDSFLEALEIFSTFFTTPLFTETAIKREINAVDSENSKNIQSDMWRQFQLFKFMGNQEHPFSSFSTGNSETLLTIPESLGLNIRDIVIEFYYKYYSANIMSLVVIGNNSLDDLEVSVKESFSAVKNINLTIPKYSREAFSSKECSKICEVVPCKDLKELDISFPLDSVEHLYLIKPISYISHLIGHESKGSILSALKKKGYANSLSSYKYPSLSCFSCFCIKIELTEEGLDNIDCVISCVFSYLGMLIRDNLPDWIGKEIQDIADMNFLYRSKRSPSSTAISLSDNMHLYPKEHVLCGDSLVFDLNTSLCKEFLSHCIPSNSIIMVKNKKYLGSTKFKEKWYGTEYNCKSFDEATQTERWINSMKTDNEWENDLHLPSENPFVPTDFTLYNNEDKDINVPRLIEMNHQFINEDDLFHTIEDSLKDIKLEDKDREIDNNNNEEEESETTAVMSLVDKSFNSQEIRTFFKQDKRWDLPKVNVIIKLESIYSASTPHALVLTNLLTEILKENLNEYAYYADCSGLYYSADIAAGGIDLSFYGYQHKISELISKTIEELVKICDPEFSTENDLYVRLKDKLRYSYYNYLYWTPYQHCMYGSVSCIQEGRWTAQEKYLAILNSSQVDLKSHASLFLKQLYVTVLVHGNASVDVAKEYTSVIKSKLNALPLPSSHVPFRRNVLLKAGYQYLYRLHSKQCNPDEVNSAIENLYFIGRMEGVLIEDKSGRSYDRIRIEALGKIVVQLINEPAFDELRTKEQLGYLVHSGLNKIGDLLSVQVIIQSNHKDPPYLDQSIETFLINYREKLISLTQDELDTNKKSVCDELLEKYKNLNNETSAHWEEIKSGTYFFDRNKEIASYISNNITLNEVIEFYDSLFSYSSTTRRKMSSQFFGKNCKYPLQNVSPGNIPTILIKDPIKFKKSSVLDSLDSFDENVKLYSY